MEYKACSISGLEGLYLIGEDGSVYANRRQKILKQQESSINYPKYSYRYVILSGTRERPIYMRIAVHRLVALHFIGPQPSPQHEVDHIDGNKKNNHYTNLQWITHQQNMIKARKDKPWHTGRVKGYKASEETRRKQAERKYKKVLLFNDTQKVIYKSVEECLPILGVDRRSFNRYANSNKTINGLKIKVL